MMNPYFTAILIFNKTYIWLLVTVLLDLICRAGDKPSNGIQQGSRNTESGNHRSKVPQPGKVKWISIRDFAGDHSCGIQESANGHNRTMDMRIPACLVPALDIECLQLLDPVSLNTGSIVRQAWIHFLWSLDPLSVEPESIVEEAWMHSWWSPDCMWILEALLLVL